jgi:hypothetical protein
MEPDDTTGDLEAIARLKLPGVAIGTADGVAQLLLLAENDIGTFRIRRASKKTALRFAVGEPGRRGTIWRLWASRDTDDVYLGSRHTSGEVKLSLHQSGDWRLQVVNPDRPKTVRFGRLDGSHEGRILDRWRRPETNAVGWTHALTIILPEQHMVPIPDDDVPWEDVRWLSPPGRGEHVAFEVSIVTPGHGIMSYRELLSSGGRLAVMDALQLAGGDVAIVLALTVATNEVEAMDIARCEAVATGNAPPATEFDPSPQLGPRHLVHGAFPDGRRRYYDLTFTARD